MQTSRRSVLKSFGLGSVALGFTGLSKMTARAASTSGAGNCGPLLPDPDGILDLPAGFKYKIICQAGDMLDDGTVMPGGHDGMGSPPISTGPVRKLIFNHELSSGANTNPNAYDPNAIGGTSTVDVALSPSGDIRVLSKYTSSTGTIRNCAGGTTHRSWLTCEETFSEIAGIRHGYVFEVPGRRFLQDDLSQRPIRAMGRFSHEAVAQDPTTGIIYETEDRGSSAIYRFTPNDVNNLHAGGTLEALKSADSQNTIDTGDDPQGTVYPSTEWVPITEPDPASDTVRVEAFAQGAMSFSRGEGMWTGENGRGEVVIYWACTNGGPAGAGQIWCYNTVTGALEAIAVFDGVTGPRSPDNIVAMPNGIVVAEDGSGQDGLWLVRHDGTFCEIARHVGSSSEVAGPVHIPYRASNGDTFLFFNIQSYLGGVTVGITGPFDML